MKTPILLATAIACSLSSAPAEDAKTTTTPAASKPNAKKDTGLRKAGFMFTELETKHVAEYMAYFEAVAGFRSFSEERTYGVLVSDSAEFMFVDPEVIPGGHPFHGKLTGHDQGLGVEIGIVVADLDKAFAAAATFKNKGWKISSGIAKRPWGVRDFRILTPDDYYIRFTEGDPKP